MSKVTTQFNNYLGKRQRAIVLISPKLQVRDALVFHFPAEASLTRLRQVEESARTSSTLNRSTCTDSR